MNPPRGRFNKKPNLECHQTKRDRQTQAGNLEDQKTPGLSATKIRVGGSGQNWDEQGEVLKYEQITGLAVDAPPFLALLVDF